MEYCGRTEAYEHKFDDWRSRDMSQVPKAVRKVTFLDVQWSDCPVEISAIVKMLWSRYENGNDRYIINTSIATLTEARDEQVDEPEYHMEEVFSETAKEWVKEPINYQGLIDYLREQGVADDEQVIIHYWW